MYVHKDTFANTINTTTNPYTKIHPHKIQNTGVPAVVLSVRTMLFLFSHDFNSSIKDNKYCVAFSVQLVDISVALLLYQRRLKTVQIKLCIMQCNNQHLVRPCVDFTGVLVSHNKFVQQHCFFHNFYCQSHNGFYSSL